MNNAQTLAYFQNIVDTNKLLLSFCLSPRELKEKTNTAIDYPAIVLADEVETALLGQDTPHWVEKRSIMILSQASSEAYADVIDAMDLARTCLIQTLAYIIARNEQERNNFKAGIYLEVFSEQIREVGAYTSDRLYGYRLYYTHREHISFFKNPNDWL